MRGRPRKPTQQKVLEGTYRKDRDNQLDLPTSEPPMPLYLGEAEQAHWRRLVPLLINANLLAEVDGDGLAMLCCSIVEFETADAEVKKDGMTGLTDKGYRYILPAVSIRTNAWKKVCHCLRQFGMTPSARASMKPVPKEAIDDFEAALNSAAEAIKAEAGRSGSRGDRRPSRSTSA